MSLPNPDKTRILKIEKLQQQFDNRLATLDSDLLSVLLGQADKVLASPASLARILTQFETKQYTPVLEQFGTDLLTIKTLNDAYFQGSIGETMNESTPGGVAVNDVLFEQVSRRVETFYTERFGNHLKLRRLRLYETPTSWADCDRK